MRKAVVFDVDGVMIDSFKANHQFFCNLFPKFGYEPPTIEEYEKLFPKSMMDVIKIVTKSSSEKEIIEIWEAGRDRDSLYSLELVQAPKKLDETIEMLSQEYQLAVVTSRIRGAVFSMPKLINIEKYFQTAVYYEDTEKHKPDPEPLILCARRLDINPEDIVYIGDAQSDAECAQAVGAKFILYKKENSLGVEHWTSDFAELSSLIKKIWI